MKLEVTYGVVEVTRYRVTRSFTVEGGGSGILWSTGCGSNNEFGEYDRKEDAETVAKALEAVAATNAREGL